MKRSIALSWLLAAFAAAAATAADEPQGMQVEEIRICRDVDRETRTPLQPGDRFAPDVERLYCFTRLVGAADTTQVTHLWLHDGRARGKVPLAVGSPDWRTWSSKTILPRWTGEWEVRVLDRDGLVLGSTAFRIQEAARTEEGP